MIQIVIPAAGRGTRLKLINPYGLPKSLIEINGKKILDFQLEVLKDIKNKEFIFITGSNKEKLKEYIYSKNLEKFKFVDNNIYKETNCGYSLGLVLPIINNNWIYLNSDLIIEKAIIDSLKRYIGSNAVCVHYGKKTDLHQFTIDNQKNIKTWIPIDKDLEKSNFENIPKTDGEIVGPIIATKSLANHLLEKFNSLDIEKRKFISCYGLFSKFCSFKYQTIDISKKLWKEIDTDEDFFKAEQIVKNFRN